MVRVIYDRGEVSVRSILGYVNSERDADLWISNKIMDDPGLWPETVTLAKNTHHPHKEDDLKMHILYYKYHEDDEGMEVDFIELCKSSQQAEREAKRLEIPNSEVCYEPIKKLEPFYKSELLSKHIDCSNGMSLETVKSLCADCSCVSENDTGDWVCKNGSDVVELKYVSNCQAWE